ncbi:MAG: serine/threonine protein kinase [Gemmataceae bacterium]|nr:serine/threonine protein kinase [Gemmataceae bacterium]
MSALSLPSRPNTPPASEPPESELIYEGKESLIYRRVRGGRKEILKLLKPACVTPERLVRFRQEHELVGTLSGEPRIVGAYGVEKLETCPAIVFEDCGAQSLKQILDVRTFGLVETLTVAVAVAEGLGAIHAARVIHKDINLANIVMNRETGLVKIIDFGIANRMPRENLGLVSPRVLQGTLAYILPEQTGRMNRVVDYRSDFYSFGVTLYQMLTGALPFTTNDALELIHWHIAKQPTPPCHAMPEIPEVVSAGRVNSRGRLAVRQTPVVETNRTIASHPW